MLTSADVELLKFLVFFAAFAIITLSIFLVALAIAFRLIVKD